MKKTILLFLILLTVVVLAIRLSSTQLKQFLGINQKSGLNITSIPDGAVVFLDGKESGKTPYENKELEAREYLVKLQKDTSVWQRKVSLVGGSLIVINRELAKDVASSSGEILTLKKGVGMTVISEPTGADIEIDGKPFGKTPSTVVVSPGDRTVLVSHADYLKRSIKTTLPLGYNLILSVDLALSEADLTSISTPVITTTPMVVVKSTPTGFLRVRDKPAVVGKEVAQVKPGEELILLEEQPSWYRVRLSNNVEGYVSSAYVEKKLSP